MLPRSLWPLLSKFWIVVLVLATIAMLIGLEMAIFGYFPGMTDPASVTSPPSSSGLTGKMTARKLSSGTVRLRGLNSTYSYGRS